MEASSITGYGVPVIQSPWVLLPVPFKSAVLVDPSPSTKKTITSSDPFGP